MTEREWRIGDGGGNASQASTLRTRAVDGSDLERARRAL